MLSRQTGKTLPNVGKILLLLLQAAAPELVIHDLPGHHPVDQQPGNTDLAFFKGADSPLGLHDWQAFGCQHKRSEEHTSELQSRPHLVCRLLLEKKKTKTDKFNVH